MTCVDEWRVRVIRKKGIVILNAVKDPVCNDWVNNRFFASLRMTCEHEWRVRVIRKKGIVILNAVKDLVRND